MSRLERHHDVIVVGARPAGAATAMLLARRGWDVLALERGNRGADTLSTHALMKAGVLQLHRWGLLDAVRASGAPPIDQTTFHYGDESIPVTLTPAGGVDALYAPRRTVLDPIVVGAAEAAGAEVRFGSSVSSLIRDGDGRVVGVAGHGRDGRPFRAHGKFVVGADGARSMVAHAVGAAETFRGANAASMVYAYFDDPTAARRFGGYEWCYRPASAAGVIPTNDGVLAWIGVPRTRYETEIRRHVEPAFWRVLAETGPEIHDRLAGLSRTSRWHTYGGQTGFMRRCAGPGWGLVGDASHFTDPLSTHGLSDALRDAELLARAVHVGLTDPSAAPIQLANYQHERDRLSLPLLTVVDRLASYQWGMDELRLLLRAVSEAMRAEMGVLLALDEVPSHAPA